MWERIQKSKANHIPYQVQYNENMMRDDIWGLVRQSTYEHERKSNRFIF